MTTIKDGHGHRPRLDEVDERQFWADVRAAHAALTDEERAAYVPDATLMDNLHNDIDDEASRNNAW